MLTGKDNGTFCFHLVELQGVQYSKIIYIHVLKRLASMRVNMSNIQAKFIYFINKNSSTRIKIKVTTQGEVCDIHFRTNNFSAHSWDLSGCRGKNIDKNIDMLKLHSFVKNNSIVSHNKHSTKLILPSPDRSRNWTIS